MKRRMRRIIKRLSQNAEQIKHPLNDGPFKVEKLVKVVKWLKQQKECKQSIDKIKKKQETCKNLKKARNQRKVQKLDLIQNQVNSIMSCSNQYNYQSYRLVIMLSKTQIKLQLLQMITSQKRPIIIQSSTLKENEIELMARFTSLNINQIKDQHLRIFLTRLGQVLNGWKFTEQEKEHMFFGITKLLLCANPELRRLTFKILQVKILYIIQMINVRKFLYIIMQSLISDLSSNNIYLKQNALQYIPLLDDAIYLLQVDKYIRNVSVIILQALLDQNEYISNQAIILELKLYKKFPQIVNSWYCGIIIEKLTDSTFPNKQHALNLVHEIKKTDIDAFIKIIIQLIRQELNPLVKIQLIRYIGEILLQNDICLHKLQLEQYLFKQIHYQEPIVFIETARVIIKIPTLNNQQLEPLLKIIFNQLDFFTYIEAFAVLKLIKLLLKDKERKQLIQENHLSKIQNLMFSCHSSVSSYAILLCIKAYKNNKQLAQYFQQICSNQQKQYQFNMVLGMLEFVHLYKKQADQIIRFLQLIIPQKCSYELAKIAFKITERILKSQIICLALSMRTLFWIAQSFDDKHKLKTIRLIQNYWHKIPLKGKSTKSQFDELQKHIFQDFSITLQTLQLIPLIIDY
ncbi:hypothetical protein pb186bvf_020338 [Paramecium bursaria]